jgi:hypothetical protein
LEHFGRWVNKWRCTRWLPLKIITTNASYFLEVMKMK